MKNRTALNDCDLLQEVLKNIEKPHLKTTYSGWLRTPAPPKGWLKHVDTLNNNEITHVIINLSTGAGFLIDQYRSV